VWCRNRCGLHLLFLEADGLGSKHHKGFRSHARSRCAVDLSTATQLFSLSNGMAAEP
jgi:hypothetical protein